MDQVKQEPVTIASGGATIEELSDDGEDTQGETLLEKIKRENVTDTNATTSDADDDTVLARIKTETQINEDTVNEEDDDDTVIDRIISDYTQQHEASYTIKADDNDDEITQQSLPLFSQYN